MPSVIVKRPIQIIVITTETFKQDLLKEIQESVDAVQRHIEQMEFQGRRALADLQRTNLNQAMALRQQLEAEKRKYEDMKKELEQRREEVEKLELDEEYPRGTMESEVEIKVGDNLFEKLSQAQIIIKDGVVQDITE
jgi:hypothetical protein